jgi:hypothetical protein
MDELVARAGAASRPPDPALLDSIANSIKGSTRPVRPLPPLWLMTAATMMVCVGIAVAGAAVFGFYGFEKLGFSERMLIFCVLGALIWLAAQEFVRQMVPGSRLRVTPGTLLQIGVAVLIGIFALLFHDYHTAQFVSAGVVCLSVGVAHAVPTGLLAWLVLRRGFAVNGVSAGLAAGTLGGLAGVAMLELHCLNFEALHIIVWHTAVIPVSGLVGVLIGWVLSLRAARVTTASN